MFRLEISTDNDAFAENPAEETARILGVVAERVMKLAPFGGVIDARVFDYFGNQVGTFTFLPDNNHAEG